MGSVLSAASWASCCDRGLAGGWFLCPAPSSSSPSSEARAAESARTTAAPTPQLLVSHARRERAERACALACGWQLQEHAGALKKCQIAKWPSDAV